MTHRLRLVALVIGLAAFAAAPVAQAGQPGFVDPQSLLESAGGDDAIKLDVQLQGVALKALCALDHPIGEIACNLTFVRALILDVGGADAKRLDDIWKGMEKRLSRDGWSRLATVRDGSERIHVLLREDPEAEKILGLTVLVIDGGSGEMIFTNLVGNVDLEMLRSVAGSTDIPGLDVLEDLGR